jgi:hypothetical protein
LVIVTVAVAGGLHMLAVTAPPTWWMSPFDRAARPRVVKASGDVERMRDTLAGRRQRIRQGPPVPPGVLRALQPLIRSALERAGIDARDRDVVESFRGRLSPLTFSVLTSVPLRTTTWFRTVRPDARETAALVEHVLDELDLLSAGGSPRRHS